MPGTKHFLKRMLVAGSLTALLGGAYWGGKRVARAGLLPTGNRPVALKPVEEEDNPAATSGERLAATARMDREAIVRRLLELGRTSPRFSMDAKLEMDGLAAKLSASDLADLYAKLDQPGYLAVSVAEAWIAKDPTAAMVGCFAKDPDPEGYFARMIFNNWAMDHPAAALGWLDSEDLPASLKAQRERMRFAVLPQLAERDFIAAAESCRHADDAMREKILASWGTLYGGDPAMRSQLVDFAKSSSNPADYAALNRQLVTAWPQDDSIGMMNYLIGLKDYLEAGSVPAASRSLVEGSAVAAAISREYDRPALEWWMERHASDTEVPMALQQGFGNWGRLHPDKAEQWLAEQPESPQKEALQASIVVAMAATAVECDKAAAMLEKIQDPEIRQQAATKLYLLWHESHPTAAETWKKGYAPQ